MRLIGRIKSVKPTQTDPQTREQIDGYFFITGEDGVDRFAHNTQLPGMALSDALIGLYVDFEPVLHVKGPRALRVQLLGNTPTRPLLYTHTAPIATA